MGLCRECVQESIRFGAFTSVHDSSEPAAFQYMNDIEN